MDLFIYAKSDFVGNLLLNFSHAHILIALMTWPVITREALGRFLQISFKFSTHEQKIKKQNVDCKIRFYHLPLNFYTLDPFLHNTSVVKFFEIWILTIIRVNLTESYSNYDFFLGQNNSFITSFSIQYSAVFSSACIWFLTGQKAPDSFFTSSVSLSKNFYDVVFIWRQDLNLAKIIFESL